ncbi:MAG: hypothetical protein QF724_06115 [Planctomycetota bacterium]|nr:hypothetical protein [Planctomycetota bacterium]MDP6519644.1 hypothetical protein [Planctomycetota bacterium]MDP6838494.1 hypothetical protein [Planctomycetota bacterium]MDP6955750.1 hypothetical protein [Planctomycetota bacterium]
MKPAVLLSVALGSLWALPSPSSLDPDKCTIIWEKWTCPAEDAKWSTLEVCVIKESDGDDCESACQFSAVITLVADSSWAGTATILKRSGDYDESATPPYPDPDVEEWKVSSSGDTVKMGERDQDVACGATYLLDASYATNDCPTSDPDGPGPCSIASLTVTCNPCSGGSGG